MQLEMLHSAAEMLLSCLKSRKGPRLFSLLHRVKMVNIVLPMTCVVEVRCTMMRLTESR
jgi:hypothetical protein